MKNEASCLCGSVTWEITAEPFQAFNCHCKMCRKAHGTAYATYWFLRPDQFRWSSSLGSVVSLKSSTQITRCFCKNCGSVVPYFSDRLDELVVPAGCHDHGTESDCNIFVAHKAPWFDITDELPRHDNYPPYTGYERVEEEPMAEGPPGIVRGSCLCGAVEVQLTEPFRAVHNCHCSRCRRARAAAHATNGFTSTEGAQFTKGEEHVKSFKPVDAKYFAQAFCELCGSKVTRFDPIRNIAITPLGMLDDDPGTTADDHIFVADMAGWHEITDDLPRFEAAPPRRK